MHPEVDNMANMGGGGGVTDNFGNEDVLNLKYNPLAECPTAHITAHCYGGSWHASRFFLK